MPVTSNIDDLLDATPAARAYADALPPGRLVGFRTTELDRLGVPAWAAVYMDGGSGADGGIVQHGMGFGLSDGEALVGAAGELAEYAHSHRNLRGVERVRGSYADLRRRREAVDPLTLCLPVGSPVTAETELEWVVARRWPSGEGVLVPMDVVAVSYGGDLTPGYEPFTTLIGNGLGAGPTLEWAVAHGLGELLQRDGNGLAIRALATDVVLDLGRVEDPATRELIERIRAAGIEPIAKVCSDEFGVANLYVVGDDRTAGAPVPMMMAGAGEAAHPDGGRALRKALLEFSAARARLAFSHGPFGLVREVAPPEYLELFRPRHSFADEEDRALDTMLEWLRLDHAAMRGLLADKVLARGPVRSLGELPRWQAPTAEAVPGKALCDELARRPAAAGFDVLYVDHSPPDAAERGVHVARVVVPGLEVETMSYYRVGERNARRLLERGSDMVGRGEPAAGALPVRLTADAEARLGGPVWFDPAAADRAVGALYPLYREPEYHSTQVALEARVARAGAAG